MYSNVLDGNTLAVHAGLRLTTSSDSLAGLCERSARYNISQNNYHYSILESIKTLSNSFNSFVLLLTKTETIKKCYGIWNIADII